MKTCLFLLLSILLLKGNNCQEDNDEAQHNLLCQTFIGRDQLYDKCIQFYKDFSDFERTLRLSIPIGMGNNSDWKNVEAQLDGLLKKRLPVLRDLLNKMHINEGFPGLMEDFRVFGIPMSKLWALMILLDPFEI